MLYDAWRFAKTFAKTMESHPSLVHEMALKFCPRNTVIFTTFHQDQGVNVVSGSLQNWSPSLMLFSGFCMEVASLTLSRSGDTLTAGSVDGTLKVWNTSSGIEILSIPRQGQTDGIVSALLSGDGTRVILGLLDGDISVMDVATGDIRTTLNIRKNGPDTWLYCIALAADECTVFCGFQDGPVQIWNLESQVQLTPLLVGHVGPVYAVDISHNQEMFLSCSEDETIRLWSRTGAHERTFIGHTDVVHSVAFSPDDSRVASAGLDATMKIWDTFTGELLFTCLHDPGEMLYTVKFSHKGDRVATGSLHSNVRIWDSTTGNEVLPPLSLHRGAVMTVAFAPDDKTLVSGADDAQVRIWSLDSVRSHPDIQPAHTLQVHCVALSHDKAHFVSGSKDRTLILWNARDGSASFPPFRGHGDEILSVDFSPDDTMIASGSKDGAICIWDTATGQMVGIPLGQEYAVVSVKFSPDGSALAMITDSTLTVWNLTSRTILFGPLSFVDGGCKALAFSHDSSRVATFYDYESGGSRIGVGITINDAFQGDVLFQGEVDSELDGEDIYSEKMEYTVDDKYLVISYGLAFRPKEEIIFRAFDATTGEEYDSELPALPAFSKLAALEKEIIKNGQKIAEMPLDLEHMGQILCWDATEHEIVVGTRPGDVYYMSFPN
jgi:WD40 repeat protein